MSEMIKYPHLEQFRNAIRAVSERVRYVGKDENGKAIFNQNLLPTLKYKGHVKLHGTNASIAKNVLTDETWYQSRERIITPVNDNAGFASFCYRNRSVFDNIFSKIIINNSDCKCNVVIYGEWCGGNIQKGVAICELPKMFVIFGIKVGDDWVELSPDYENADNLIFCINRFKTFDIEIDFNNPELSQNKLAAITEEVEACCPVGKYFGVEGIGEGVVWSCIEEEYKGSSFMFKVKGEKHSASKVKKLANVDVEKVNTINELVDKIITPNRLNQAKEYLMANGYDFDVKNIGIFLKWISSDAIREELDTIVDSGLEPKEVAPKINIVAKKWFFDRLQEV